MSPSVVAAVLAAGFAAGAINTIVGSGSLITFPVLLLAGFNPITANVSNTVGLVFGSISGVWGYRREMKGQWRRAAWLALPALLGALLGAVLLLVLPQSVFRAVVPALIVLAVILVVLQPRLVKHLKPEVGGGWRMLVLVPLAVFGTAIYGGYFGAAQGVILMSLFAVLIADSLQRLNALKNAFSALVNGTAAVYFIFAAHVNWEAAILIAVSSTVGAQVGALAGRRLSPRLLRGAIVVTGSVAVLKLLV